MSYRPEIKTPNGLLDLPLDAETIRGKTVGYIELDTSSSSSGTLTDAQYNECLKDIVLIKNNYNTEFQIYYKYNENSTNITFKSLGFPKTTYGNGHYALNVETFTIIKSSKNYSFSLLSLVDYLDYPNLTSNFQRKMLVTSWQNTPDNTHYPSEKLVKDNLNVLVSQDQKALYHLGEYDTTTTDANDITTITRQTGYGKMEDLTWINYQDNFYYSSGIIGDVIKVYGTIKVVAQNYIGTDKDGLTSLNANQCSIDSNGYLQVCTTGGSPKGLFQYKLATSYTEQVPTNLPLNTLDQQGSEWLRDEWEKQLNLFNGEKLEGYWYSQTGAYTYSTGQYCSKDLIPVKPNTTYSGTYTFSVRQYDINSNYITGQFVDDLTTFTTASNCYYITLNFGSLTGDFMLNEGDHAYPYQEYKGKIIHEKDLPKSSGSTPNDSTITIQKNGTTVDTFTTNQATDKTVNILVNEIIVIDTQYVRITDLVTGVYKLTYNGQKYIYYKGTTDMSSHGVANSSGEVILIVNKVSNTNWNWYYISSSSNYQYIFFGYTSTSSGSFTNKSLNSLLTSHQSIKTLNTTNTTPQTTSSSEALNGSGTINLHQIAKTGSYNDLRDKPNLNENMRICGDAKLCVLAYDSNNDRYVVPESPIVLPANSDTQTLINNIVENEAQAGDREHYVREDVLSNNSCCDIYKLDYQNPDYESFTFAHYEFASQYMNIQALDDIPFNEGANILEFRYVTYDENDRVSGFIIVKCIQDEATHHFDYEGTAKWYSRHWARTDDSPLFDTRNIGENSSASIADITFVVNSNGRFFYDFGYYGDAQILGNYLLDDFIWIPFFTGAYIRIMDTNETINYSIGDVAKCVVASDRTKLITKIALSEIKIVDDTWLGDD